jgi:hypothetical protein
MNNAELGLVTAVGPPCPKCGSGDTERLDFTAKKPQVFQCGQCRANIDVIFIECRRIDSPPHPWQTSAEFQSPQPW